MISNTPGVLTETVAEFAVGLIFAITKRIAEADKFTPPGKICRLGADALSRFRP